MGGEAGARGSAGFFVAPAVATPALNGLGVSATALFIPPAVLMGFILLRSQRQPSGTARPGPAAASTGRGCSRR